MENVPALTTDRRLPTIESAADPALPTNRRTSGWHFSPAALASFSKAKPLAYSLSDQTFSVGGTFLINVMLARTQSKEEYGMFALCYSIYTFLTGLHNAAILEPCTVYGSGRYRKRFPEYISQMAYSNALVAVILTACLLFAFIILRVFAPHLDSRALLGLALTVGVLLSSSFLRRVFYIQGRAALAAKVSFVFFVSVVSAVLLTTHFHLLNSFSVFLILALGWIAGGAAYAGKLSAVEPRRAFLQAEPGYWHEHWKYAKWVLATAFVFQLTTQGYYWLVAGLVSVKDVAQLKAIYILVTPVDQFFIAVNYLVLPAMAAHFAAGRMGEYFSLWRKVGLGTVCVTGLFAAGVRMAGRSVIHVLYAGKFDGVVPLLFLLALLPLLMGIGNTMNDALKAAEMPKLVFYAYLASGAATLFPGIPLVRHFGLQGAVYGMLASGATYSGVLALGFLFQVSLKSRQQAPDFPRPAKSQDFATQTSSNSLNRRNPRGALKQDLAPIVLFVYNRPEHTRRTVESLLANDLALQSQLFVFSDGAKNQADSAPVEEVRRYVRAIEGFRSVTIVQRDLNSGLAQSVIRGVTEIFQTHGRQIVMEDDLLTAPDFLTFMNAILDHYEQETSIFSVTGFNYAVSMPESYGYDAVCSHRSSSWGWGTWKDRWARADWDVSDYAEFRADKNQQRLLNRGGADLSYMLGLQMAGMVDSWAIRWAYAHFKHDAVAMVSTVSKVYNIGFDGSGVHCRRPSTRQAALARNERLPCRFPDSLQPDPYFLSELRRLHPYPSLGKRLLRYLYRKAELAGRNVMTGENGPSKTSMKSGN
jgi:O-antigen/teichoic acid export membrane protein